MYLLIGFIQRVEVLFVRNSPESLDFSPEDVYTFTQSIKCLSQIFVELPITTHNMTNPLHTFYKDLILVQISHVGVISQLEPFTIKHVANLDIIMYLTSVKG